jgi:hypothetical protein
MLRTGDAIASLLRESRGVPCGRMAYHERAPPSVLPAHIHVVCPAAVPLLAQARAVWRAAFGSSTQSALVVSVCVSLGHPVHKGGMGLGWMAIRKGLCTHKERKLALVHRSVLACLPLFCMRLVVAAGVTAAGGTSVPYLLPGRLAGSLLL